MVFEENKKRILNELQDVIKQMIFKSCKNLTEEGFNNLIANFRQTVYAELKTKDQVYTYAENSYKMFVDKLQDVEDVDFDKEVKLLAKVLEKTQSNI